jgi:hypothetical protein
MQLPSGVINVTSLVPELPEDGGLLFRFKANKPEGNDILLCHL